MRRALLAVLLFALGVGAGVAWQRQAAMWAVMVVQAESAAYKLAAIEVAKDCAPKRGWFKR